MERFISILFVIKTYPAGNQLESAQISCRPVEKSAKWKRALSSKLAKFSPFQLSLLLLSPKNHKN